MRHISLRGTAVFILLLAHMAAAGTPNRVTILYDSFGKSPTLTMDWGFAALVDYGGKRILFDTGNNAQIFEHNVKAAGVDLQKLDFVVMSHRHGDHMGGLAYLLKVNPTVKTMRRRRGPESTATPSPAVRGIARTRLCPRNSGITAARRPKSYTWEKLGPAPTFS